MSMSKITNHWVTEKMLRPEDFSKYQLALSLSCALCQNIHCKSEYERIYKDLKQLNADRAPGQEHLDGKWLSKLVESAIEKYGAEQRELGKKRSLQIKQQDDEPWRFKKSVGELSAMEMGYLAEECLLNGETIQAFRSRIDNIKLKVTERYG